MIDLRKVFAAVWASWIDENESVYKARSWRTATLRTKAGSMRTVTMMPLASWRNGWRPWERGR